MSKKNEGWKSPFEKEEIAKPKPTIGGGMLAMCIVFIIVVPCMGFITPSPFRMDHWPDCQIRQGMIIDKGYEYRNISFIEYKEYYLVISTDAFPPFKEENSETLWVSPAQYTETEVGTWKHIATC